MRAPRKEFTRSVKLAALKRDKGRCVRCGKKLGPGDGIEYDHRIRCEAQEEPDNSLENCDTLCGPCHGFKTHKEDAPAAAKSRSVRARHFGASKPRRIMLGSRASRTKKQLDGKVASRCPPRDLIFNALHRAVSAEIADILTRDIFTALDDAGLAIRPKEATDKKLMGQVLR